MADQRKNKLIVYGTVAMNKNRINPLGNTYLDKNGSPVPVEKPRRDGLNFYVMGTGVGFGGVVFRVEDTNLSQWLPFECRPGQAAGGGPAWDVPALFFSCGHNGEWQIPGEISPAGKLISHAHANRLLDDAIRDNPDQGSELGGYRPRVG